MNNMNFAVCKKCGHLMISHNRKGCQLEGREGKCDCKKSYVPDNPMEKYEKWRYYK